MNKNKINCLIVMLLCCLIKTANADVVTLGFVSKCVNTFKGYRLIDVQTFETKKDWETLYREYKIDPVAYDATHCITTVECVALGYCKAESDSQQQEANKIKNNVRQMIQERRARAAQLESDRKAAQEAKQREKDEKEKEKARKQAEEKARIDKQNAQIAAEAKQKEISFEDAKRLSDSREKATKKMPSKSKNCDIPPRSGVFNLNNMGPWVANAKGAYAGIDSSKMCDGKPGTLGPMNCKTTGRFFGKLGKCTATWSCPGRPNKCGPGAISQ